VGAHITHWLRGVPTKSAVVVGLIVPNLIVLFCANLQYMGAVDKSEKLFSTDCNSFQEKRRLQASWEAAYNLYMNCIDQTSARTGHPRDTLIELFRIQDCEEYAGAISGFDKSGRPHPQGGFAKDWTYLRSLEEDHFCSGWCYRGQQLWATKTTKDSCTSAVSHIYRGYVRPHTSQVCMLMLAALACSSVLLIMLGPVIRKQGLDW